MLSDWICEFCYKPADGDLPPSWKLMWQSAVCPDCQEKVAQKGGYGAVVGGAFAFGKDPRVTQNIDVDGVIP